MSGISPIPKMSFKDRFFALVFRWLHQTLEFLKGLVLIFPIFIHECLLILIVFSVSIGISAVLSFLYEICWYRRLRADVQAVLGLMLVTALGESVTLTLRFSYLASWVTQVKRRYPWTSRITDAIFCFVSASLVICSLYIGYRDGHPSPYFGNASGHLQVGELVDPGTLNAPSTFMVLCGFGFMTYFIPRGADWMTYRFRMTPDDLYVQMGSRLYFAFFVGQVLLLCLYALPLLLLAAACLYTSMTPMFVFAILMLHGAGLGLNVAQLEYAYISRFPPMSPPFYPYENHMATRINLFQYILIPMVTLVYYGTGPVTYLSAEYQFYLYTFLLALGLLQATKCICNNGYLESIRRWRRNLRNNNRVQDYLRNLEIPQCPTHPPGLEQEVDLLPGSIDPSKKVVTNEIDMDELLHNVIHPPSTPGYNETAESSEPLQNQLST